MGDDQISRRINGSATKGKAASTKQIILSVKSGHVNVTYIRDLRGVIEREKAEIGVLLTLEDATKPMRTEAASAGFYKSLYDENKYPRLQILTIAELLEGKGIGYPQHGHNVTFKRAPRAEAPQPEQLTLAPAEPPKPRFRRADLLPARKDARLPRSVPRSTVSFRASPDALFIGTTRACSA